ncbi:MAG: DUF2236 domain-containing protein [Candidatus Rokubacteria bacterium]|nr:DUF2236 domain-containing protein [Candidatus Rokubacteria bacterium]
MTAERAVLPGVGSVAWRIHREIVILLAWGRAILLQFAHPLVARGVADHSPFRTERWGRFHRLYRTLDAMLRLTFGTAEEAERVARRINGIHDRIHGRLGEAAAGLPEGTPYSAHDPALLKWVHATLLESHLLVYELYVGALTPEEKDRYCAETTGMESLLGMPEGYLPRSLAGLQDYISGTLGSGEIAVTDVARELGRDCVSGLAPGGSAPHLGRGASHDRPAPSRDSGCVRLSVGPTAGEGPPHFGEGDPKRAAVRAVRVALLATRSRRVSSEQPVN